MAVVLLVGPRQDREEQEMGKRKRLSKTKDMIADKSGNLMLGEMPFVCGYIALKAEWKRQQEVNSLCRRLEASRKRREPWWKRIWR